MATFVLIHGAWHGGWCWPRVAEPLRQLGHRVFTPTLSGLGERAHLLTPQVDLITHVHDVVGVIEAEELDKVVLCGHSYGGMVITGAADAVRHRIDAMVYLDAFLPEPNHALIDCLPPDRQRMIRANTAASGWMTESPPATAWRVRAEEDRVWVDRRTTPHPAAAMSQPLPHSRPWEGVRKAVYVRAEGYDPSPFGPIAERLKGDPRWQVLGVPCGHDVMLYVPQKLVDILIDASK
jgi:pimeloyl-ACP methyl ester carboxylesterase